MSKPMTMKKAAVGGVHTIQPMIDACGMSYTRPKAKPLAM